MLVCDGDSGGSSPDFMSMINTSVEWSWEGEGWRTWGMGMGE